jgi:tetratricopeptide (TPR) repeat protein
MTRYQPSYAAWLPLLAVAAVFVIGGLRNAAYSQEWKLLSAECERLIAKDEGTKATQVAAKCRSVASSQLESCRSLLLSARASLCANDIEAAGGFGEQAYDLATSICQYDEFNGRLPEVAIEIARVSRNNKDEAHLKEIDVRRWEARTDLEGLIGPIDTPHLTKPIVLTPQQCSAWQMLPQILRARGHISLGEKRFAGAENHFREALRLGEHFVGTDSPEYAELCSDMGCAYAADNKDVLAVPFFEEAIRIFKTHRQYTRTAEAQSVLANSLEKTGDVARAASLRSDAAAATKEIQIPFVLAGVAIIAICLWTIAKRGGKTSPASYPDTSQDIRVTVVTEPARLTYQGQSQESDRR